MIKRYSVPEIEKIWSAEYKFNLMLKIELLVLEALCKEGRISKEVLKRIKKNAKFNLDGIKEREKTTHHDVVAFVLEVCSHLNKDSKYFHWGLTSNDVLDTSLCIQLKESLNLLLKHLEELALLVKSKAKKYKFTLCVGRTHGIHAEVYSLGLKFALFLDEIRRNQKFLKSVKEEISVGKISGAVGTYSHLPPSVEEYVLKKLGLKPASITTQVIPRDRFSYLLSCIAILASCFERFATEIRHLQRTEVREVFEPFYKGQKGSSAMPHKRNPILCERMCGLARLIRAYLEASLQNIVLWHERDISHSSVERVIFPDTFHLIIYMTQKMTEIVKDLEIDTKRMKENLKLNKGLIFSQRLMLALTEKGLKRQDSYDLVQELAFKVQRENKDFKNEVLNHPLIKKILKKKEIQKIFSPAEYLKNISKIYERLGI